MIQIREVTLDRKSKKEIVREILSCFRFILAYDGIDERRKNGKERGGKCNYFASAPRFARRRNHDLLFLMEDVEKPCHYSGNYKLLRASGER